MALDTLFSKLKGGAGSGNFGHGGRPGKKGGSSTWGSRQRVIYNPSSVSEVFNLVKTNESLRDKAFEKMTGMKKTPPSDYRVPLVMNPKTGQIIANGLTGSHLDMVKDIVKGGSFEENKWIDSHTRFDLNFNSEGKINKVQMIQGAAGVGLSDREFEDKSLKNIYRVLDKVKLMGVPSNTIVEIELESDKFPPDILETTVG